jgi:hypothetical protein
MKISGRRSSVLAMLNFMMAHRGNYAVHRPIHYIQTPDRVVCRNGRWVREEVYEPTEGYWPDPGEAYKLRPWDLLYDKR